MVYLGCGGKNSIFSFDGGNHLILTGPHRVSNIAKFFDVNFETLD